VGAQASSAIELVTSDGRVPLQRSFHLIHRPLLFAFPVFFLDVSLEVSCDLLDSLRAVDRIDDNANIIPAAKMR
jgi:hypothetical protein